jgi:hypothetical protein
VREKSFRPNRIRSLAKYYRTLEFYDIDCRAQPEDSHLAKLLDNPTVFTLALLGTSVIGFRVSLLYFRSLGFELDRDALSFSAKFWACVLGGEILLLLAMRLM